jgi:hypothetical protein
MHMAAINLLHRAESSKAHNVQSHFHRSEARQA